VNIPRLIKMRIDKTDKTDGDTPFFWCRIPLKKIEKDFAPIIIIPWLLFVAPLASQP